MGGVKVEVMLALGTMMLIILTIALVPAIISRRRAHSTYQRRMSSPPPRALIGKGGVYDEDRGYYSLRRLREVAYVAEGRPQLRFTVRQYTRSFGSYDVQFGVTVPPGCEGEAQAIAARFYNERHI